ncbi:MAG: MarR family transcriptional regulator [Acidobacteria bacterium]|nr:MarR family transcriptional regulator [Acidobacteriota bacterium]
MGSEIVNGDNGFEKILNTAMGIAETWNEKTNSWLRENHITLTQFKAIILLSEKENQTLSQLSNGLSRTRCTMTGLVDRLEDKGLVRRKRSSKDRRLVYVSLTDKGRELAVELMDKVVPEISRIGESIMGRLTDSEVMALYSALGKLSTGIGEIQTRNIASD